MNTGLLKNAFKATGRTLSRHASSFVCVCFTAGNVALAAKAGLHPDLDTAAGLLFIAQSISLGFTKKYPTPSFRCAGALGLLASACMSARGIDFHTGHVLDMWRVAAPM